MSGTKYLAEDSGDAGQEQQPADDTGGEASPQIGALTATNLARHTASLDEEPQPAPEVRTLGSLGMDDPDLSARRAAYLQRKESRREGRKQRSGLLGGSPKGAPGVDSNAFLSNVPEVEADVDYRFNFVVVGAGRTAERAVELACNSEAARKLPSGRNDSAGPDTSSRANARAPQAHRCLCAVTSPGAGKGGADLEKLTKLVFHAVSFGQELPACSSRLQALGTALVFVLTVDAPPGEAASFQQQLECLADAVEGQRQQTRAKFRPVRAVVLCSAAEGAAASERQDGGWATALADFEATRGDMWKFGPLPLGSGDMLHAAFAEMAATRILQGHGAALPGEDAELEPGPMAEGDEDEERALLEQQLQQRAAPRGSRVRSNSQSPSECSEGWQRPPVFEAEFDGSQCSEEILERHAQAHGLDPNVLGAPLAAATNGAGVPGGESGAGPGAAGAGSNSVSSGQACTIA